MLEPHAILRMVTNDIVWQNEAQCSKVFATMEYKRYLVLRCTSLQFIILEKKTGLELIIIIKQKNCAGNQEKDLNKKKMKKNYSVSRMYFISIYDLQYLWYNKAMSKGKIEAMATKFQKSLL